MFICIIPARIVAARVQTHSGAVRCFLAIEQRHRSVLGYCLNNSNNTVINCIKLSRRAISQKCYSFAIVHTPITIGNRIINAIE
jgi:hypothetical protein